MNISSCKVPPDSFFVLGSLTVHGFYLLFISAAFGRSLSGSQQPHLLPGSNEQSLFQSAYESNSALCVAYLGGVILLQLL